MDRESHVSLRGLCLRPAHAAARDALALLAAGRAAALVVVARHAVAQDDVGAAEQLGVGRLAAQVVELGHAVLDLRALVLVARRVQADGRVLALHQARGGVRTVAHVASERRARRRALQREHLVLDTALRVARLGEQRLAALEARQHRD